MNKKLWGGIVVTALVVIAIVVLYNNTQAPVVVPSDEQIINQVVFYDQSTGEALPARFYADKVTFESTKLGTLTLPQTISADGARYANTDESIVFWNKGDSVFVTQNGIIVFNGSIGEPTKGKLPAGSSPAPSKEALVGTWIWQKTTITGGADITPKKPGAFTATFSADGKVGGKTDCNGYGGSYTVGSEGIIKMSQFISTLMYCEGSQEQVYTGELLASHRYSFDAAGNLVISINNGTGSMVFSKQ